LLVEASSVEPQTASVAQSSVDTQSVDVGKSVSSDNFPANILLNLSDPSVGSESAVGKNDAYFSSLVDRSEHTDRHLYEPATLEPNSPNKVFSDFSFLTSNDRHLDGNSKTDLAIEIMEEDGLLGSRIGLLL
jgi:hypothetical protein